MSRSILIVGFLLVVLSLCSCVRQYRLPYDELPSGNQSFTCRLDQSDTTFNGELDILWETRTSGKPNAPMSCFNGTLIYPETKKRIRFYRFDTGEYLGKIKCKGVPQTAVVISDSLAYFAVSPKRNWLYAYDLVHQKVCWRRRVKDAGSGPIIVDDCLLIGSGDGILRLFALDDGTEVWSYRSGQKMTMTATVGNGRLYQPIDRGELCAVSLEDGHELYRVELQAPIGNAVTVGEYVFAADIEGWVYALQPGDGSVVWQTKLDGPIWTSPAVAGRRVYVGHSGGEVVALQAVDGEEVWRFQTAEVVKASPVVIGEFVVVGTMGGKLFVLHRDDGTLVATREVQGAIAYPPISDGIRVVVVTQAGRIICFGEKDEQTHDTNQGISPKYRSE